MRRLAVGTIVAITAVVTAALTSLFWIVLYNVAAPAAPRPGPNGASPPSGAASTTVPVVSAVPIGRPRNIAIAPSGLAIPVAGVGPGPLVDPFTQARSGGRIHDAIDIMAPAGTPVVSASDGTVEKLFFSQGGGGITVYIRSPDQTWSYYYAHLQAYAPGLREGQRIARGDPVGLVGSTGNANPAGPHLHFAIHRMAPQDRWWQGSAINPYPLLAARRSAG